MHVTVAGKQVETGEALQTHVREGLATITQKYFDHALEANVTFRRDVKGKAGAFACDINLKAGRNLFMRGEGEGVDAHRAFEVAAQHVAKRLRRYRRRVNEHARSMAEVRLPDGAAEAETATQYVLQPDDDTRIRTPRMRGRRMRGRRRWRPPSTASGSTTASSSPSSRPRSPG